MPETPFSIRASRPEDVPAIAAIYADAVLRGTASFELEPPGEAEMAARREGILEQGLPYIVAEAGGAVAGYSYAGRYRPRPAYDATVENTVYVHKDFRRRGVARALLLDLIAGCRAAGKRQMVAVIGDSPGNPSVALHESLGFRPAGRLYEVGFKNGRWLDSLLMQRAL